VEGNEGLVGLLVAILKRFVCERGEWKRLRGGVCEEAGFQPCLVCAVGARRGFVLLGFLF